MGVFSILFYVMKIYEIKYGHHTLHYSFHYEMTPFYMRPYISESSDNDSVIISPLDYMQMLRPYYPENQDDAYVEYKSLINLSSLALINRNAVFFHGVAIKYKGKAWIFTGRSGAGKTTQYKKWKIEFRDKIELICGDMPCLEVDKREEIHVYPSPWNGKERYKGKSDGILGGFIFLEKKNHNEIVEMSKKEALPQLFKQFAIEPRTEKDIRSLSKIADIILSKYPIMKLYNKADKEAVTLCSEYLEKYL